MSAILASTERLRFIPVCLAAVAFVILTGCGSSNDSSGTTSSTMTTATSTTTTSPSTDAVTPEDAIRNYLAASGKSYVGDCPQTSVPADVGKYCSILQQDSGTSRTYLVGPVASEGDVYVVTRHSSGWRVTSVTRTPPLAP